MSVIRNFRNIIVYTYIKVTQTQIEFRVEFPVYVYVNISPQQTVALVKHLSFIRNSS